MFILIGRIFYALVWLFLLFNLISPYRSPANIVCYVALAALVLVHGLQAWLLNSTLTNQEKEQDKYKALRLFLFGSFEAMSWKQKKNK